MSTRHEAQQVPKGAVRCGAWLRDQEEEEAYGRMKQCLCFKWLSQILPQLGDGNSLLIVLSHPSPAQLFGSGETTSHWLENNHVTPSQPMRDGEFGCDSWNRSNYFGPDLGVKPTC